MDLKNAYALVTGGSSGIGYETARELAAAGAKVAICGRRADRLMQAANDLGVLGIPCDISEEASVKSLIRRVTTELGDYNVLINNAAFGYSAPLLDIDTAKFTRLLATNITGTMLVTRESARIFVDRQNGNIVNVGSTSGSRGYIGGTTYVASKFALRGMNECWRAELRTSNVRVMEINPSEVLTDFARAAGRSQTVSDDKLRPTDIAHAILGMLTMDDRGFTTDVTIWATNPRS
jgi:3-oxoacyl-[acyl-carrier protein] reductase